MIEIGLAYQLIGTSIWGWAIAFTSDHLLKELSVPKWDRNSDILRSLIIQRYDVRFGVALILVGTLFQLFSGYSTKLHSNEKGLIVAVTLLPAIGYFFIRKRISAAKFKKLLAEIDKKHAG